MPGSDPGLRGGEVRFRQLQQPADPRLRRPARRLRAGGTKSRDLAVLFQSLREQLVPLVAAIAAACCQAGHKDRGDATACAGGIPLDRQKVFGEAVAAAVGFDFQRGRLDVTAHPFCTGIGPGDYPDHHAVRRAPVQRRLLRHSPRGRPRALRAGAATASTLRHAVGEAVSLGVHESQSRLWENARRPQPAVLDLLVSAGPAGLPRGPARRHPRRFPGRGQPCRAVA